jgi:hypothetical protein
MASMEHLGLNRGINVDALSAELLSLDSVDAPYLLREDITATKRARARGRKTTTTTTTTKKKKKKKKKKRRSPRPASASEHRRTVAATLGSAAAAAEVQRALQRQELSVESLIAGAHTHPSILLAKDLYAEKLRSMRLQRELSSSRVQLRKSLQREKDARRSAVQKRNQAAKSVWNLLEQASKRTQRMPPLTLSQSVPQLARERDPVMTLRAAVTTASPPPSASALNAQAGGVMPRYKSLKEEGKLGLRRQWHARVGGGNMHRQHLHHHHQQQQRIDNDLPLRTALILRSPSARTRLKNRRRPVDIHSERRRRDTDWDTWTKVPSVPLPLPVYEQLHSRQLSGGSLLSSSSSSHSSSSAGTARPSTAPSGGGELLNKGTRDCALRVGGAGPWANSFPGQRTKDALGLSAPQSTNNKPETKARTKTNTKSSWSFGYLELVGDSAVEYVGAPSLDGDDDSGRGGSGAGDFDPADVDIFAGMKNRGLDTKTRAARAYFDFCLDVKTAARARRRLLSVVLGSMHIAIDREAQEARRGQEAEDTRDAFGSALREEEVGKGGDGDGNVDIERGARDALNSVRPTTEEFSLVPSRDPAVSSFDPLIVDRGVIEKLVSSWRLQGALPKDSLDRLCGQLPVRRGERQIDLRALERAMRASVGPRGATDPRKIVALVQPKPKPIMALAPPKLPGSKLDRSKTYRPPSHALEVKKSRWRWDADSFDATSLYILPLAAPPS